MTAPRYLLADPTGNLTLLTPGPPDAGLAAALLAAEPTAEQLGFLGPGRSGCDLTLTMAGGEFCGNAAMSAAAWWCREAGISAASVSVAVSGAAERVAVEVCRLADGAWRCAVTMPAAAGPVPVTLPLDGGTVTLPLMDLGGIRHLILTAPMAPALAETAARTWCTLLDAPALGLMQLDEGAGTLTPLVYVPGADTLFWEHSCASGTAAAGVFLARRNGAETCLRLAQPGGTLEISAAPEGPALLRGTVRLGAWKEFSGNNKK